MQSRVNGGLSVALGSGYVAGAVSFGIGLVIISVVMLVSKRGRVGLGAVRADVRARKLPVWALFGGAAGALFVLCQGLVTPILGLAMFTVGIVAGQVLGGLLLDTAGLGPSGRIRPTPMRVTGTVLAVVAVVLTAGVGGGESVWLLLIPVLIGAGVSAQSMVNGLVRASARSAVTSTFLNFVVGFGMLAIIAVISIAVNGWPTQWPTSPMYYIGGLVGTIFIAIAAMLVRAAGVLLLSMSNVAGQLIAAVALEAGLPLGGGLTTGMIFGAAVALLAVVLAALPARARS